MRVRYFCVFMWAVSCVANAWPADMSALNEQGLRRMKANDYAGAIERFEAALAFEPDHETIVHNLACAHNALGVELGSEERWPDAIEHLSTALDLLADDEDFRANLTITRHNWAVRLMGDDQPDDAEHQLYRAYETASDEEDVALIDGLRSKNYVLMARAQREDGRNRQAQRYYRRALDLDRRNTHALVELGQLLYDDGETADALACWLEAQVHDADVPGLDALVERASREMYAEADHTRRSNGNFTVSYEGRERRNAAREVLDLLDEAYREMTRELKHSPGHKIHVVLYTREQFASVTLAPHWSGAVYDGKIRIPLAGDRVGSRERPRLRRTLKHEYVHAVVHDLAGHEVPSWFNEGLATYYELGPRERRARADGERHEIIRLARGGALPSVGDLPDPFTSLTDAESARRAYLLSRGFVTWLAETYRPYRFRRVLEELGEGRSMDAALRAAYRKSLDRLEKEWHETLN